MPPVPLNWIRGWSSSSPSWAVPWLLPSHLGTKEKVPLSFEVTKENFSSEIEGLIFIWISKLSLIWQLNPPLLPAGSGMNWHRKEEWGHPPTSLSFSLSLCLPRGTSATSSTWFLVLQLVGTGKGRKVGWGRFLFDWPCHKMLTSPPAPLVGLAGI